MQGLISAYAWLCGGEIPSQRLRSYTFGLAAAVGFFFAWLTTFTAPYFINPDSLNWGPQYGYIWFPSAVVGAVWVWFFLPETKGRTLEEIDEMVCDRSSLFVLFQSSKVLALLTMKLLLCSSRPSSLRESSENINAWAPYQRAKGWTMIWRLLVKQRLRRSRCLARQHEVVIRINVNSCY